MTTKTKQVERINPASDAERAEVAASGPLSHSQPDTAAARRARDIYERLSLIASIGDAVRIMPKLINQAYERKDHETLGYASWEAYVAGEYGDVLPRLSRARRKSWVGELTEGGLSTREIAPVVGADHVTVARDRQPVANATVPGGDEVGKPEPDVTTDRGLRALAERKGWRAMKQGCAGHWELHRQADWRDGVDPRGVEADDLRAWLLGQPDRDEDGKALGDKADKAAVK